MASSITNRSDSAATKDEPPTPGRSAAGAGTPQQLAEHELRCAIEHATHLLPCQGPISIFVHHNTLHAFEEMAFEQAVVAGGRLYDCEPYLTEGRFRRELRSGRIRVEDLQSVLLEDLGEDATRLVATFGTRYALRLAMLQFPLRMAPDAELEWLIAETDAQEYFREEVEPARRQQMVAAAREWVQRELRSDFNQLESHIRVQLYSLLHQRSGFRSLAHWGDSEWESFTLHLLWRVCNAGVAAATERLASAPPAQLEYRRLRDVLLQSTGRDADRLVDEVLIRFTAAFLDQGFADWDLPGRELGYFHSFAQLFSSSTAPLAPWLRGLPSELREVLESRVSPAESIVGSLTHFGVAETELDDFALHSLLALRGWAGLIWQMETNAPWTPLPAPTGTLEGFLAVRLILERYALRYLTRQEWPRVAEQGMQKLRQLREQQRLTATAPGPSLAQQAFTVFQLAQVRGWTPQELIHLDHQQWQQLLTEIGEFSETERRRVFHLAYERKYRDEALAAVLSHRARQLSGPGSVPNDPPAFQIVCCIDDREESFRRHLEECDPECQTFAAAGFYAVAMYYQGAAEAHYRPLCPIVITPEHYVREESVFSATDEGEARSMRRRWVGHMTHQVHAGSRTMLGGVVTGVLGSAATLPLVARILAPRLTARLRSRFGSLVRPPATELHIERIGERPGPAFDGLGYSIAEMAGIVTRILQDIGLVENFAPIVLFTGHGSSSMNNPHESAYNCGACSGGRGGPNARSFALMANDPRVRQRVAQQGIAIPNEVRFVGCYHNTCNDHVEYFDLDQLPRSHRELFRRMERSINEARARNAHEPLQTLRISPTGDDSLRGAAACRRAGGRSISSAPGIQSRHQCDVHCGTPRVEPGAVSRPSRILDIV